MIDLILYEKVYFYYNKIDEVFDIFCNYIVILFIIFSPKCELRLNLIHSYDGVEVLQSKILRPSMPLTHLRVFFCEQVCNVF